jgi:hypothetical protein
MLQIRSGQVGAFERADLPEYTTWAVGHLDESFPKHCRFLGPDGVRDVIGYGIETARAYGLTWRSPVTLFIDLTLLLGRSFHRDVQFPWASGLLADGTFPDELAKARWLHAAALDYLNTASGPENEHIDAAQRRLLHEPTGIAAGSPRQFADALLSRLRRVWPEKYAAVGEPALRSLVLQGVGAAGGYGITSPPGVLVYVVMMYMLGSGFDHDPLFAWARGPLADRDEPDQAARAGRLRSAGVAYLTQWCA